MLLDAREGHLYADAGLVSFASGWSFPFVAGMSFTEIHGPVPRANPGGVFTRAEAFLMRLQPGEAYRRVNWAFQPGRILDKSIDNYAEWMPEAARILGAATDADFGDQVNLRVELQHLIGLETADAVLFHCPSPRSRPSPPGPPASLPSWTSSRRTWPTTRASPASAPESPPGSAATPPYPP